jgi:hypothetical protein
VPKQLTSFDKVHQEVNSVIVLEHILHIYQKWVVDRVKNIFFKLYIIHLLIFKDNVLSDTLHCIQLTGVGRMLHQENLAECTLTDQLLYLEVFQLRILLGTTEHSLGSTAH